MQAHGLHFVQAHGLHFVQAHGLHVINNKRTKNELEMRAKPEWKVHFLCFASAKPTERSFKGKNVVRGEG